MSNASFLPEDYLARKTERRTNLISLVLFAVVMCLVFAAFFWTNQTWTQVKREQSAINARYQKAADDIQDLSILEQQKREMLQKADLAAALVERVPRSILLAELINRMPSRLSLVKFELKSERIKTISSSKRNPRDRNKKRGARRGQTRKQADDQNNKIRPPKYRVSINLVGLAPTDLEVSRYLAELNAFPLLHEVSLDYSTEKEVQGEPMREFAIKMLLDPKADVREIEPLIAPRIANPMSDTLRLGETASVDPRDGKGN